MDAKGVAQDGAAPVRHKDGPAVVRQDLPEGIVPVFPLSRLEQVGAGVAVHLVDLEEQGADGRDIPLLRPAYFDAVHAATPS